MSGQTDIEGLAVDYAQPPEFKPTPPDRVLDPLALKAGEYNQAQRSGIIEGALWACRSFTGASDDPMVEARAANIEAVLRKRFGDEHVDREKQLHDTGASP